MIVVCDPVDCDWTHVPINAALLEIIHRAYPDEPVQFHGEPAHLAHVQQQLSAPVRAAITWHPTSIPPQHAPRSARWRKDLHLVRKLMRAAGRSPGDRLVLLAAKPEMVLTVKLLMRLGRFRGSAVQIVCHGQMSDIRGWRSRNPFFRWRDMRSSMTMLNHKRVRFILLEEAIRRSVAAELPGITPYLDVLHHPVAPNELPGESLELTPPVRFGFLGFATGDKGFAVFLDAAERATRELRGRAEFHAIGWLGAGDTTPRMEVLASKPAARKIDRDEFLARARELHFICLPYQGQHYEFSPSGVLLDAIALGKPIVAIRVPQTEDLFGTYGEIGYLCEDAAGFFRTVARIVAELDRERYAAQVSALTAAREARSPAALARLYRTLTDAVRDDAG